MKIRLVALAAVLATSGCTPKTSDYVLRYSGQYKAIADCAYPWFRDAGWTMTDLPTKNMVEFDEIVESAPVGRIEVVGESPTEATVTSYQNPGVWGKDHWAKQQGPVFDKCSRQVSAITPLSKDPG